MLRLLLRLLVASLLVRGSEQQPDHHDKHQDDASYSASSLSSESAERFVVHPTPLSQARLVLVMGTHNDGRDAFLQEQHKLWRHFPGKV